ncbi:hypothetical protein [Flavobacterium mesophilum]|uniref:hypothetical protein n=1 Tax=Flavobacterium mesophilum TaxID=3143495 RepID=UPI0031DF4B88
MKKTILLFLIIFSCVLISCNQQTIETYNNTVVHAHDELFLINNNFYKEAANYIGNPKSKKLLTNLIEDTKRKTEEGRKSVEDLVPFKDHGLRRTILEMYDATEDAMYLYEANAAMITADGNSEKVAKLFEEHIVKYRELDQLIRELQVQYAYYNKLQLR